MFSRANVLVADDEPLTRWALMQTLAGAQIEVTLASSRDEVCRLLSSRRFQVAVLAHQIGQDSMVDVLDDCAHGHGAEGLVILYDGDNAEEFGRSFPSATLVQKPFGLEAVTSAVESYLEASSEAC